MRPNSATPLITIVPFHPLLGNRTLRLLTASKVIQQTASLGSVAEGPFARQLQRYAEIFYLKQPPISSATRNERLTQLRAQAAVENDPKKLQALVEEILELFDPGGKSRSQSQKLPGKDE